MCTGNDKKPAEATSALTDVLSAGTLFNTVDGEHMVIRKGDGGYWCMNTGDPITLDNLFKVQMYLYSEDTINRGLAANK